MNKLMISESSVTLVPNLNLNILSCVGKTIEAIAFKDETDYWGDDGFTLLFTDGTMLIVGASDDCGFPCVSTVVK